MEAGDPKLFTSDMQGGRRFSSTQQLIIIHTAQQKGLHAYMEAGLPTPSAIVQASSEHRSAARSSQQWGAHEAGWQAATLVSSCPVCVGTDTQQPLKELRRNPGRIQVRDAPALSLALIAVATQSTPPYTCEPACGQKRAQRCRPWAGGGQGGMRAAVQAQQSTTSQAAAQVQQWAQQRSLDATCRLLLAGSVMLLVCQNRLKRSRRALHQPADVGEHVMVAAGTGFSSASSKQDMPNQLHGTAQRSTDQHAAGHPAHRMRLSPWISSMRKNTALSPWGTCRCKTAAENRRTCQSAESYFPRQTTLRETTR